MSYKGSKNYTVHAAGSGGSIPRESGLAGERWPSLSIPVHLLDHGQLRALFYFARSVEKRVRIIFRKLNAWIISHTTVYWI
jgi:hypothetical protein